MTVELMELDLPMVIALNMMDEADRVGIRIDIESLSARLGMPVVPMIASKGRGIQPLFVNAFQVGQKDLKPFQPQYSTDLEQALDILMKDLKGIKSHLKTRALALKLLEGDREIYENAVKQNSKLGEDLKSIKESLYLSLIHI